MTSWLYVFPSNIIVLANLIRSWRDQIVKKTDKIEFQFYHKFLARIVELFWILRTFFSTQYTTKIQQKKQENRKKHKSTNIHKHSQTSWDYTSAYLNYTLIICTTNNKSHQFINILSNYDNAFLDRIVKMNNIQCSFLNVFKCFKISFQMF